MIKLSHFIVCAMAIWTAVLLFWTSQSVQKTERELKKLKESNYSEFEMVRVLSSEWDYLNRPERLEKLAQEYLTVDMIKTDEKAFLTSAELIDTISNPVIPSPKPNKVLTFVADKPVIAQETIKVAPTVQEEKNIISKPEQEKFTSMIDDLTESER